MKRSWTTLGAGITTARTTLRRTQGHIMAVIKENDIKLPVNVICRVEHEGTTSFVYQAPGNSELTTNTQTDVLHWSLRVTVGNAIEYTPAAYVMYRSNSADNVC